MTLFLIYGMIRMVRTMNKKGFTLVELLAVIVILGLLATVAVTSAINVSTKLKVKMYCEKVQLIESGAKQYGADIIDSLDATGITMTVGDLVKQGAIKKDEDTPGSYVQDPRDKSSMDSISVRIYLKNKRAYVHVNADTSMCE